MAQQQRGAKGTRNTKVINVAAKRPRGPWAHLDAEDADSKLSPHDWNKKHGVKGGASFSDPTEVLASEGR